MQGDGTLFARADEIELAWRVVDPILADWAKPDEPALAFYEPGSWRPVVRRLLVPRLPPQQAVPGRALDPVQGSSLI